MAKIVVLAEKPSVARDIARVLKCNKKGNGFIEGDKYIVTWALGHLVGLADPEAYGEKYKTWSMETLPMLPNQMKLVVLKGGGKQFKVVKDLLIRKDVAEIVIATDAGREGELVARWIVEKSGVKKPMKRLWISSVTDEAIKTGFQKLKPAKEYDNLYKAAVCRAEGDWVVGLNITRALTCKYNASLTAGRVQSATLAMIVARDEEIKKFKPKPYFQLKMKVKGFELKWQGAGGPSLYEEAIATQIAKKVENKTLRITSVTSSPKKEYAPPLYDLTLLQRDANRLFGMSPKETLNVMQRLYENHKVLTYPRTDSKYITTDMVGTLKDRLQAIATGNYREIAKQIASKEIKANKSFVDNAKVSDHHAIIPTEQRVNLANLSQEERKIFDLVAKRFLSVLLPPCEVENKTIEAQVEGERFTAKGRQIKVMGWRLAYDKENFDEDEENEESTTLPPVEKDQEYKVLGVKIEKLFTKAPAPFTEATLLGAMEHPEKHVNLDKEAAKKLGETGGIGTVATRADIIEKLYNMFYIEKQGNSIFPTSKGKQLIDLVPAELKSPLLTAKWEKELELISKGKQDPIDFSKRMRNYSKELVETVKKSKDNYVHDNMTGKRCPHCGKNLLEVKGKRGMMYVCQDRNCGHKENLSIFTNTRCPNCHKKLELRGEGEGKIYVCTTCTFREKANSFDKKFRDKGQKVNKKEAQNYMKKMQKESQEEGNFAFAEAFKNLGKKD
jgi:DNA topoisomerase-3